MAGGAPYKRNGGPIFFYSYPEELEVGTHRAPYLLFFYILVKVDFFKEV